ncbi:hypothetical protein AGMMS49975_26870 [Clostridia bacterium]|nr:hypothetical protein AGMMS49975_26870 [Clostridia bacterium]
MIDYGVKFRALPSAETKAVLEKVKKSFDFLESAFSPLLVENVGKAFAKSLKEPLKKITIPNIAALGYHAVAAEIAPMKFQEWYLSFFNEENPSFIDYSKFCKTATAAGDNVLGRYKILKASFEAYFKIAFDDFLAKNETDAKDEDESEDTEEKPKTPDYSEFADDDDTFSGEIVND